MTCKCSMRTRVLGDGCQFCNPELAKELAMTTQDPVVAAQIALNEAVQQQNDHRMSCYGTDCKWYGIFEEKVARLRKAYNAMCIAYGADE